MKNTDHDTVGIPQGSTGIFDSHGEMVIDGKRYLIERHFTEKRDFRQAVFSAALNEAKRENPKKESA